VFGFRAMKEIKKKLKRRRPVWSLGMLAVLFAAAAAAGIGGAAAIQKAADGWYAAAPAAAPEPDLPGLNKPADKAGAKVSPREAAIRALAMLEGDVELILHRVYWCGEETRMLGRHSGAEAAELLKSRREWSAAYDPAGRVLLEETVEDLSPACRQTAYIGMDTDGNLSLFNGPPRKDNVVRTFFQLDVPTLESSLSKDRLRELAQGIRVADRDEYNSVLSSFSDYAARKSKGVMKHQP
jgi:forespore regulator of the sigma-K checkpoint